MSNSVSTLERQNLSTVRHTSGESPARLRVCVLANWNLGDPNSTDVASFFQFSPENEPEIKQFGTSSWKLVNLIEKRLLRFHVVQLFRAWSTMRRSDVLMCFSSQSGLPAALWKSVCRRRTPRLVVIDIENLLRVRRGPLKKLVDFAAQSINDLICFASFQMEGYRSVPAVQGARMTFIPFGFPQGTLPRPSRVSKNDSIVAIGHQDGRFRDWTTLVEAYLIASGAGQVSGPLVIVGRQLEPSLAHRLGSRLITYPYLSLDRLAEVVAPAAMCIVPLPDRPLSFGQGSIITLMGLRKIVVTANIAAVRDYVEDGKTAFVYAPGDARSLASVMQRVQTLSVAATLQVEETAYKVARTQFDEPVMARRIFEFIFPKSVTRLPG